LKKSRREEEPESREKQKTVPAYTVGDPRECEIASHQQKRWQLLKNWQRTMLVRPRYLRNLVLYYVEKKRVGGGVNFGLEREMVRGDEREGVKTWGWGGWGVFWLFFGVAE